MKRRSLVARFLVVALVLLAASCEEPDYGDEAKKFVDGDASRLSRQLAADDLESRWLNIHQAAAFELVLVLPVLSDRLRRMTDDITAPPGKDADLAFTEIDDRLDRLNIWLYDLQDQERHVTHVAEVCSSRTFFESTGLSTIGTLSPLSSIAELEPEIRFEFSKTFSTGANTEKSQDHGWLAMFVDGIVQGIENWSNAEKIQTQNRKLREAKQDYLAVAIKGDELFSLSEKTCNTQLTAFAPLYESAKKSLTLLRADYATVRELAVAKRRLIEVVVVHNRIREREAASGVLNDLKRVNHDLLIGNLRRDLARVNEALARLDKAVDESCGDISGRRAFEDLSDALSVTNVQIATALSLTDIPTDLHASLLNASHNVKLDTDQLGARRKALMARRCR